MFLRFLTLDRGNPPPWTDFSVMIYQRKRFDATSLKREGRFGREEVVGEDILYLVNLETEA